MPPTRNRRTENTIYASLWIIVTVLYILDMVNGMPQRFAALSWGQLTMRMVGVLLPFFLLFLVNNFLLIPRLLRRNRIGAYLVAAAGALAVLWLWQYIAFITDWLPHEIRVRPRIPPRGGVRPLLPMPLFLDFIYGLLVIGVNLAVSLLFQRFDDKLEHESLLKLNAENRLSYLKAQINPHFYMNMLNNIHGMIEIDPAKAQKMVIEMSQLMRYMLYESTRPLIPLTGEIKFLKNYTRLMRQRFPESKVAIETDFPDDHAANGKSLPPLLFLVFIENAFKHGVSYRADSYVRVAIRIEGKYLHFQCENSLHDYIEHDGLGGIGLENVGQRLSLLYGKEARLDISKSDLNKRYKVELKIPLHETPDNNN